MDSGNHYGSMGRYSGRAADNKSEARPMTRAKLIIFTHVIPALFAVFCIGPIAYLALDRASPYDRQFGYILPSNPKAGDRVAVHWTGERKRSCFGVVHRQIVDSHGVVYAFEAVTAVYAEARPTIQLVREFSLPAQISAGPAVYRSVTRFVCNPIQNFWPIIIAGPDVLFNIAE